MPDLLSKSGDKAKRRRDCQCYLDALERYADDLYISDGVKPGKCSDIEVLTCYGYEICG